MPILRGAAQQPAETNPCIIFGKNPGKNTQNRSWGGGGGWGGRAGSTMGRPSSNCFKKAAEPFAAFKFRFERYTRRSRGRKIVQTPTSAGAACATVVDQAEPAHPVPRLRK